MNSKESELLRQQLVDAMRGHQAHIDFDSALQDFPAGIRGIRPAGAPHTAWQLLEHMRIAQWDILEFSRNPEHQSPHWPEGYWPESEAPPDTKAWDAAVAAFRNDSRELNKLVVNLQQDLFQPFKHGEGQTLLREVLLVANHNSYHLGQLVFLKKMLLGEK